MSACRRMGVLPRLNRYCFLRSPWDYKLSFFGGKYAMIQVDVAKFFGHAKTLFTRTCLGSRNWQGKGIDFVWGHL